MVEPAFSPPLADCVVMPPAVPSPRTTPRAFPKPEPAVKLEVKPQVKSEPEVDLSLSAFPAPTTVLPL